MPNKMVRQGKSVIMGLALCCVRVLRRQEGFLRCGGGLVKLGDWILSKNSSSCYQSPLTDINLFIYTTVKLSISKLF